MRQQPVITTYKNGVRVKVSMTHELYIGRSPTGTSFFYAGRVYERAEEHSLQTVKCTLNAATWTNLLMDARKVSQAQTLEILADEPNIPGVRPLSAHGYAPLPQRDYDFLVKKAAKLAQKKVRILQQDDSLRKQHADDNWMHKQKIGPGEQTG